MSHYNLPHNHGQSIDRVLENMPTTESFQEVSILFQQLGEYEKTCCVPPPKDTKG